MNEDNEIKEFREGQSHIDRYGNELDFIESWANELSVPTINKMAKALVKRMNTNLNSLISDNYYDLGIRKFFDYFTISFQSMYIDEIVPNLTDVLEGWIDDERDNLSETEKFILHCSTIMAQINSKNIVDIIYQRVMNRLIEITNRHYETQRIQKIADKIY